MGVFLNTSDIFNDYVVNSRTASHAGNGLPCCCAPDSAPYETSALTEVEGLKPNPENGFCRGIGLS
jgi:hypothetical protein